MTDIEELIKQAMIKSIKAEAGITEEEQGDSIEPWLEHRPNGKTFKPLSPVYAGLGDYLPYRVSIGTQYSINDVRIMLHKMFGPQSQPVILSRYYLHPHYIIHFRDEKDATMFLMRWS